MADSDRRDGVIACVLLIVVAVASGCNYAANQGEHVFLSAEAHNLSMLVLWAVLVLWTLRIIHNAYKLWDLRSALGTGQVIRVRGLGQELHVIGAVTRQHLYSVMRTRRPPPPSIVKNLQIPFAIVPDTLGSIDPSGRGALLGPRFAFSTRVPISVQLLWGVDPTSLVAQRRSVHSSAAPRLSLRRAPKGDSNTSGGSTGAVTSPTNASMCLPAVMARNHAELLKSGGARARPSTGFAAMSPVSGSGRSSGKAKTSLLSELGKFSFNKTAIIAKSRVGAVNGTGGGPNDSALATTSPGRTTVMLGGGGGEQISAGQIELKSLPVKAPCCIECSEPVRYPPGENHRFIPTASGCISPARPPAPLSWAGGDVISASGCGDDGGDGGGGHGGSGRGGLRLRNRRRSGDGGDAGAMQEGTGGGGGGGERAAAGAGDNKSANGGGIEIHGGDVDQNKLVYPLAIAVHAEGEVTEGIVCLVTLVEFCTQFGDEFGGASSQNTDEAKVQSKDGSANSSASSAAGPTYNATFMPRILKQIAYEASGEAYVIQDIYGMQDLRDSVPGADDSDGDECVVCLTEPKTTILLPCRHLCVCSECFPQVNQSAKCPVCRAKFETYLQVGAPTGNEAI